MEPPDSSSGVCKESGTPLSRCSLLPSVWRRLSRCFALTKLPEGCYAIRAVRFFGVDYAAVPNNPLGEDGRLPDFGEQNLLFFTVFDDEEWHNFLEDSDTGNMTSGCP